MRDPPPVLELSNDYTRRNTDESGESDYIKSVGAKTQQRRVELNGYEHVSRKLIGFLVALFPCAI